MRRAIPEFSVSYSQLVSVINELICNESYKEILILRYADRKTYQEISEIVNYSITTVQRVSRTYEPMIIEMCNDIKMTQ